MPTSGGVFNQHPEFSAQVGRQTSSTPSWLERIGIARIVISITEIAAGVAASVFTAGAATPLLGVGIETGIAIAGGAANAINDQVRGETTTLGTALNIGSAFIPGVGRLASSGIRTALGTERIVSRTGSNLLKNFVREANPGSGTLDIAKGTLSNAQLLARNSSAQFATRGALFRKAFAYGGSAIKSEIRQQIGNAFSSQTSLILGQVYSRVAGRVLSPSLIQNVLAGEGALPRIGIGLTKGTAEAGAGTTATLRKALSSSGVDEAVIESILEQLGSASSVDEFDSLLNRILTEELTAEQLIEVADTLAVTAEEAVENADVVVAEEVAKKRFFDDFRAIKEQFSDARKAKGFKAKAKAYNRALGSAEFNDGVVQKAQLSDPHDLFRVPSEVLYKKIGRAMEKQFSKMKPLFKNLAKLDKAWLKLSGAVELDSSWILGYRPIQSEGLFQFVQITFRSAETNNKAPVYTWMTEAAIKAFTSGSPGRYYKRHIQKKAFGFFKGNPIAERILSFIPGQTLKNVLSLSSNLSSTAGALANGTFTNGYLKTGLKTLINNSENRVGRLVGRKLLGGLATVAFGRRAGNAVGRLGQKLATQVATPALKGESIDAANVIGKTMLSESRRVMKRRSRNSILLHQNTVKRKLGLLARVPGSVTPGSWTLSRTKIFGQ